ncbi:MAG: 50S ribosome-binding GTPase [Candidatus Heimdallarchaeota archaeon]|nr:50S ribosome-binding GTPase [Candidatus Heimdallarchaeota archaeon]MCK4954660.1 50S ribosome-binding GTPase [Candidatus Heimdallarchaeota archaeon]
MNNLSQSRNPFRRIKYITPTAEIISYAFQRSKRAQAKIKKRHTREEKIAAAERERISVLSDTMVEKLDNIVDQFPWINEIHPFYYEICDLIGNIDRIKKILGRINGITQQIKEIEREQFFKLNQTEHPLEMAQIRKEAEGRFVSLVKKVSGDIRFLIKTVKKLKSVPDFNVTYPTIVIAGAPNVGKSSLVKAISTGTPEIGEYPFTTKQIIFGHMDVDFIKTQIVDTPGLLDRPFKERNLIERQSIASIRHIADIIVYMYDVSKNAAITPREQMNLLEDISKEFSDIQTIKILNKVDILSKEQILEAKETFSTQYDISLKNEDSLLDFRTELKKQVRQIIKNKEKFKEFFKVRISDEFLPQEEIEEEYEYNF